MLPTPQNCGTAQVVHMDPVHACLAWVEIDHLVVSFPLVKDLHYQRNFAGDHPAVFAEIRRAPFRCYHPSDDASAHLEVQPKVPGAGSCFSTRVQDSELCTRGLW